jgi:type I restriction-modification system DNA methylase subunit
MERSRWAANVKSMEIVAKDRKDITDEDVSFLRENYTSMGGLLPKGFNGGAFFTPTHVAKFIWDVMKPRLGASPRILEPSVGSGVFLEHAPTDAEITALELDETSAKVTSLIYDKANVVIGNALDHDRYNYYDLVIGNPPYGESVETEREYETLPKRKGLFGGKSENAFIELAIKCAKPGGWIAFVLPMGISFAQQSEKVRKLMYETCWHFATIKLPGETFQHVGTTIPTQILIMRKITPNAKRIKSTSIAAYYYEGQQPVYMAEVTDIGYDKHGKSTDKWGDGLTQLDEIADDLTWDTLVRENLYPHKPSWIYRGKEITEYMFWQEGSDGHNDAKRTYGTARRWNEMTLGSGEEVVWNGREVSTLDFGWQDEIVAEYYRSLGGDVSSEQSR